MRLIDADALKVRIMKDVPGFLENGSSITKALILAMLGSRSATPTIDAVPVVRCEGCKHWEPEHEGYCPYNHIFTVPDWFCADGERK